MDLLPDVERALARWCIFFVLAMMLMPGNALAVELGEEYADSDVAVIISTEKPEYEVGENITIAVQVENRSARTLTLPGLCYATVDLLLNGGRYVMIDASGARSFELAPGGRSPAFGHPFASGPDVMPVGDYSLQGMYLQRWKSPSLVVRIRSHDPAYPDKIKLWQECARVYEDRLRDELMHAYLEKYPTDSDQLSCRMAEAHVHQAVNRYCRDRDTEARGVLAEIERMVAVFGPQPEILRYKGELLRKLGRNSEALDALIVGDPQAAMDWMEDMVCVSTAPTETAARLVLAKVPALLNRLVDRNDRDRLRSSEATAYWWLGDADRAIAIMEPIIPEEAARWRAERRDRPVPAPALQ